MYIAEWRGSPKPSWRASPIRSFQPDFLEQLKEHLDTGPTHLHFEEAITIGDGRPACFEVSNSLLELPEQPSLILSIFWDMTRLPGRRSGGTSNLLHPQAARQDYGEKQESDRGR